MRAFTIIGPRKGLVQEIADPVPGVGEVLIRPSHVGICGTDSHIFAGRFATTFPLVNGHEFSGTVEEVGPGVAEWRPGDRVTADPTLYCGSCYRCLRRQGNHCDRWGAIGDTHPGALAEYVVVPARNVYRVEEHESLSDAAFTEPLACVVSGIERLRPAPGDRALVFGAGPVGCLMAQMLALSPTADIVVVDVSEKKLAVARTLGARAAFRANASLGEQLHERSRGRKFDIVVDCSGQPEVMEGLFDHAAPNARIMFFGVASPTAEIRINPFDVYHNDWQILGSMAINHTFQQARDLISSGRVAVHPLLTRRVALEDVAEILSSPKPPADLKVMVEPNGPMEDAS